MCHICPLNDINRSGVRGGVGGLDQSGDAYEAVLFSVKELSRFFGEDVLRIVGLINCM